MAIDWIHRPSGPDATDGTLNLCFNALDRHVVHGRADEVALGAGSDVSYARLLEDVAAFGGVLKAFGTGLGDPVVCGLGPGREGLVALLACLRVGAVHVADPGAGPVVVIGDAVVRTDGDADDLLFDVLMRAGRTDPAGCEEVPAGAPAYVVGERTLTTLDLLDAAGLGWPVDALSTLLAGGTVTMGA